MSKRTKQKRSLETEVSMTHTRRNATPPTQLTRDLPGPQTQRPRYPDLRLPQTPPTPNLTNDITPRQYQMNRHPILHHKPNVMQSPNESTQKYSTSLPRQP